MKYSWRGDRNKARFSEPRTKGANRDRHSKGILIKVDLPVQLDSQLIDVRIGANEPRKYLAASGTRVIQIKMRLFMTTENVGGVGICAGSIITGRVFRASENDNQH